jgi:hypothetical protein
MQKRSTIPNLCIIAILDPDDPQDLINLSAIKRALQVKPNIRVLLAILISSRMFLSPIIRFELVAIRA